MRELIKKYIPWRKNHSVIDIQLENMSSVVIGHSFVKRLSDFVLEDGQFLFFGRSGTIVPRLRKQSFQFLRTTHPRTVFLQIGGNDIAQGVSPDLVLWNFDLDFSGFRLDGQEDDLSTELYLATLLDFARVLVGEVTPNLYEWDFVFGNYNSCYSELSMDTSRKLVSDFLKSLDKLSLFQFEQLLDKFQPFYRPFLNLIPPHVQPERHLPAIIYIDTDNQYEELKSYPECYVFAIIAEITRLISPAVHDYICDQIYVSQYPPESDLEDFFRGYNLVSIINISKIKTEIKKTNQDLKRKALYGQ